MKKYFLILFAMDFLLSCESEKDPCDIEYKLNEPGDLGRSEVTFLIDDKTVWYSKGSEVSTDGGFFGGPTGSQGGFVLSRQFVMINGEIVKDSNGNKLLSNNYYLSFARKSGIACEKNIFRDYILEFYASGFNDDTTNVNSKFVYLTSVDKNKNSYSANFNNPVKISIYIDKNDSICYGSFSGVLYSSNSKDSLIISSGTFDFKYDEIQYEENAQ